MKESLDAYPIYGERALKIGRTIAVADLHIGIEHKLRGDGISVPSQTKNMEERLLKLVDSTKTEEIIILGDLKHNIPSTSIQEYREVPRFVESLTRRSRVRIIKGNHDGNLEKILPDLPVLDYYMKDNVLFTHGHRWIKKKSIDFSGIVLAHSHPAIAFTDEFSKALKEPAWIRGRFNEGIKSLYGVRRIPEFIVAPAYNPLITGVPFNRSRENKLIGPYLKKEVADLDEARAYLLDGTDLGRIGELRDSKEKTG